MVFQLLADKLRSVYFKAEVCILDLSSYPPNNLSFTEHSSAGFLAEPASSTTPQEAEVASVGERGAEPWEEPAQQSRCQGSRVPACRPQRCLSRHHPGSSVTGKKRYRQEAGQGEKLLAEKWQIRGKKQKKTTHHTHTKKNHHHTTPPQQTNKTQNQTEKQKKTTKPNKQCQQKSKQKTPNNNNKIPHLRWKKFVGKTV